MATPSKNSKQERCERVLIAQEAAANVSQVASACRNARDVNLYTSDGSGSNQTLKPSITLPEQQ
jgi:hypothetical protein